ncbi:MAG: purine-binding chemotaxis protein CheW [Parvibaculaceae bacterium]|jgi:purine-binding chemotaxis protein CheW|nr:chemotaxis protein CheW [Parvibaculaceae bacterium]
MSNPNTIGGELVSSSDTSEYITVNIADQLFGISVPKVQDVFMPQQVTRVPLSMPEVAGVLNLRGRIVTVIDMRKRLGLPEREGDVTNMAVGVEYRGESYGLVIDSVGEVLRVRDADLERNPTNLDPRWQAVSIGVQRLDQKLMIILDVDKVLDLTKESKAA